MRHNPLSNKYSNSIFAQQNIKAIFQQFSRVEWVTYADYITSKNVSNYFLLKYYRFIKTFMQLCVLFMKIPSPSRATPAIDDDEFFYFCMNNLILLMERRKKLFAINFCFVLVKYTWYVNEYLRISLCY